MKLVAVVLMLLCSISVFAQENAVGQPPVNQPPAAVAMPVAPAQEVPVSTNTATSTVYVVRQIIKTHHLVVVEMQGTQVNWPAEKIFLVNLDGGKQCTLIVKEVSAPYITLDSSACDAETAITTKSSVEPALVGVVSVTRTEPEITEFESAEQARIQAKVIRDSSLRMGVNLYYSAADEVEFNSAYASTTSGSGNISAKFKTDGALGMGLSLTRMSANSFGFALNAAVEFGREIKSVTFTGAGGTSTGVGTGTLPKLSILYVEYQGVYRWDQFYLPFGINISAPYVSDYYGAKLDVKSGFGFVIGAGFIVNENISVEALARSIGLYLKESDSSGYVDYRYGTLAGATIGLKYRF